jgi:hypothetical protein
MRRLVVATALHHAKNDEQNNDDKTAENESCTD